MEYEARKSERGLRLFKDKTSLYNFTFISGIVAESVVSQGTVQLSI
jgi:hypothetical protein